VLQLVNTMSRRKEPFRPRQHPPADLRAAAQPVKVFTCGPSIYRRPHIGNYRTFLFEDVLVRYLEYLGYAVQRVINFTDVEDKTIREAVDQGQDVRSLTRKVEEQFYRETDLLRIRLPPFIPRSSTCVPQAVRIIRALLERGIAYWHGDDVFFDPLKFPGFGRLFGLDMSRWPRRKVRFRQDTYPGQQWNRGDFILWHGYREGDPVYWDTEIGRGRPSWNVQDPAIIVETLGPAIDIHCGGIDNLYRHHDYTIAVTESYTGQELAPYWLHGEHLTVGGRPMSKSRGNILYPQDVLAAPPGRDRLGEGRFGPHHLRFFLIYTHYRRRLSYTEARFRRAAAELDAFRSLAAELTRPASGAEGSGPSPKAGRLIDERIDRIPAEFELRMNDDLSAGAAFDRLHALLREIDARRQGAALSRPQAERLRRNLERVDAVLQVIF
jgi:cysteinyl-tRNA synthetase